MDVLACQISVPETRSLNQKAGHLQRLVNLLEEEHGRKGGADLIVLPELSTIEYSIPSFERLSLLAEDLEGPAFEAFSPLARRLGANIAYGLPRREGDSCFITQVVVGPDGEYVTHFDKIHIAGFGESFERSYFVPGARAVAFEVKGCRVGIILCYDFRFPRLSELLSEVHRVELIIHPVAFTRDSTWESWHHFVICRALENQVYLLSLNRAGDGWGESIYCPPWIDERVKPVFFSAAEECRVLQVDAHTIATVRETYPFQRDKKSDYTKLLSKEIATREKAQRRGIVHSPVKDIKKREE